MDAEVGQEVLREKETRDFLKEARNTGRTPTGLVQ